MSGSPQPDWLGMARAEDLDPAEVRMVLSRYHAYRRYHQSGRGGEPLELEAWFRFFQMEAASEVQQAGPTPSGCSVDPNARNRGLISKPAAFLKVLAALAAVEAVA